MTYYLRSIVNMDLSRRDRQRFQLKIIKKNSTIHVFYTLADGVPLGIGYHYEGLKTRMMGLSECRKSFKIGFAV